MSKFSSLVNNMKCIQAAILCLCVGYTVSALNRSDIFNCFRKQNDFDQCVIKTAENIIQQLTRNYKAFGLNSLEPLKIREPLLNRFAYPPTRYSFSHFYGFRNAKINKFDLNFDTKTITIQLVVPNLRWDSGTDDLGKLSIETSYWEQVKLALKMDLEEYEKKKKKYLKVIDIDTSLEAQLIKVEKADENGNKVGTSYENLFYNEVTVRDWEASKAAYEQFFGEMFSMYFNNFFSKFSLSDLVN